MALKSSMWRGTLVNAASSDADWRGFFLINFAIQLASTLLIPFSSSLNLGTDKLGLFCVCVCVSVKDWEVVVERGPDPWILKS